ncbi:hypothetical protein RX327_30865 [Bradyrhizobium sp. BEA-2-5]|uniref:hypothetical protein n=1 Tax=Bradyrhizobium sp. BEA-2-5 TaxID=3080015 RepID=UPI00293EF46B|nr:hypothetical protein [Bradyrhizobium sp. BEA-2-5]WOH80192.1 hypothetical protein RX327_30865 [Bradyrhizobium sp. BEA-2-5]
MRKRRGFSSIPSAFMDGLVPRERFRHIVRHILCVMLHALAFSRSSPTFNSSAVTMNLQVTILKLLVSYPNGVASLDALKRDMAILAKSGEDWSERTRRLAARVPDLNIFAMRLVERDAFGWHLTEKGRAVLEYMECQASVAEPLSAIGADAPELASAAREVPPITPNARRRTSRQRRHQQSAHELSFCQSDLNHGRGSETERS